MQDFCGKGAGMQDQDPPPPPLYGFFYILIFVQKGVPCHEYLTNGQNSDHMQWKELGNHC